MSLSLQPRTSTLFSPDPGAWARPLGAAIEAASAASAPARGHLPTWADPARAPDDGALRFAPHERRLLLSEPGIGPMVLDRLEALGIHTLSGLRGAGVGNVVQAICASQGSRAWENRQRSLHRALARAG